MPKRTNIIKSSAVVLAIIIGLAISNGTAEAMEVGEVNVQITVVGGTEPEPNPEPAPDTPDVGIPNTGVFGGMQKYGTGAAVGGCIMMFVIGVLGIAFMKKMLTKKVKGF